MGRKKKKQSAIEVATLPATGEIDGNLLNEEESTEEINQEEEIAPEAAEAVAESSESSEPEVSESIMVERSVEKSEKSSVKKEVKKKPEASKKDKFVKINITKLNERLAGKFPGLQADTDGEKILIDTTNLKDNTPRLLITNAINEFILANKEVDFKN